MTLPKLLRLGFGGLHVKIHGYKIAPLYVHHLFMVRSSLYQPLPCIQFE